MQIKFLLLISLILSVTVKSDDKCRVLVLEGGGDRGAYHGGSFYQLVESLKPEDVAYDVVSGISAGGLNGGAISFFEKGDEKNAREFLKEVWTTIKRENVWQFWPLLTDFLLGKQGLLDTTPLREYLTNMALTHTIKRNFTIGTTDLNTGSYLRLRNEDVSTNEDIVNTLMSTSAIPFVFPHITWRNTTFADGGTMKMMDITGGIQWCRDHGFQDNQIIVDAILCFGLDMNQKDHTNDNTIQTIVRALDIFAYAFLQQDILQAKDNYPNVFFRYLVIPPIFFDNDYFLFFEPDVLAAMWQSGQQDTLKQINKGEGKSWDDAINKFKSLKQEGKSLSVEEAKLRFKIYQDMFLKK